MAKRIRIVGTVIADKEDKLVTIKTAKYKGRTDIPVNIYDPFNSAVIGDFITALEMTEEKKGTFMKLIEINRKTTTT
jgi:ribosomal protein S17